MPRLVLSLATRHAKPIIVQRLHVLVRHATLAPLRDGLEALEKGVEFLVCGELEPEAGHARAHSVPSAVLSQRDARVVLARKPDRLGTHNFVRSLALQHAILVNAALVLEGVGTDDCLVRLDDHAAVLRHHAARGGDVNGADSRVRSSKLSVSLHSDRHDNLLEACIARTLADAVDGALHLPSSVRDSREAVGSAESQVILAVRGEHNLVGTRSIFAKHGDESSKLVRQAPSGGVGYVQRGGTRLDDRAEHAVEKLGVTSSSILGAELDILAPKAFGEGDRLDSLGDHFVLRHAQLVFHVDLRGCDKGVNARSARVSHGVPRHFDVALGRARESADDWRVSCIIDHVSHFLGDTRDGVEVVIRRDGKSRLDDVHTERREFLRDVEFFVGRERRSGRLLAVSERGVEYADVVRIADETWYVLWSRGTVYEHL